MLGHECAALRPTVLSDLLSRPMTTIACWCSTRLPAPGSGRAASGRVPARAAMGRSSPPVRGRRCYRKRWCAWGARRVLGHECAALRPTVSRGLPPMPMTTIACWCSTRLPAPGSGKAASGRVPAQAAMGRSSPPVRGHRCYRKRWCAWGAWRVLGHECAVLRPKVSSGLPPMPMTITTFWWSTALPAPSPVHA